MKNLINYLFLLSNFVVISSVYANMDVTLDEFPEQELSLPDEPEYYEDEYYDGDYETSESNNSTEIIETIPSDVVETTVEPSEAIKPESVEPTNPETKPVLPATTTVVARLAMVMQENNAEFIGYLFDLPVVLPENVDIVLAQMVFKNSKNNQRITYPYRIYAEKSSNPALLSLDNPISQRMNNVTTSFSVFSENDNAQWAQGARWTIDTTTPIQELSYKQLLGKHILLIAENNSSIHQFFNYTLNEYVVTLEIELAGVVNLTHLVKKEIDNELLADINAIPMLQSMMFNYQNNQLTAEISGIKHILAVQSVEFNDKNTDGAMYTNVKGQVIFTTATGYTITTTPVVQNMPALQTALQEFGLSQWQINQEGKVELTLANGTFLFRPAISSEPVDQLAQGIQMQGDLISFVFTDEQGELRQQLLYPVAVDVSALLKMIKMLPHTSQVKLDEMGYLSFEISGKKFSGLLSYQVESVTTRNSYQTGIYPLETDINDDGNTDYKIIYDNNQIQLLTSQCLTQQ